MMSYMGIVSDSDKIQIRWISLAIYIYFIKILLMQGKQEFKNYGHINQLLLLGHGSIGRGALPLIKRHFTYDNLVIVDPNPAIVPETGPNITFVKVGFTRHNYIQEMDKIFENSGKVKFCVNLSVDISSPDLTIYCQEKGILYIDTANYFWGDLEFQKMKCWQLCNYTFRTNLKNAVSKFNYKTTAITSCGANPGMVSWFVKQALINLAKDTGYPLEHQPKERREWGLLMKNLGVKGIHIAERDTQRTNEFRPPKQFWNTWSADGFIAEGSHCVSQLSYGTHEKEYPRGHNFFPYQPKEEHVIYFQKPGMNVHVKTWCPTLGPQMGMLITHYESFSISQFFELREGDKVVYRPTCHYAYHPSPDALASALELIGSGEIPEKKDWKVLEKEIVTGMDELGVLLYGHGKNAYWYGSRLTIEDTRNRAPDQNATALQVTSAVLAGMAWALKNPQAGFVQPDHMDYKQCLEVQNYYISPVEGVYTEWNPLQNHKNELTDVNLDLQDPWQFKNILIHK